jgi:hypothetical protein
MSGRGVIQALGGAALLALLGVACGGGGGGGPTAPPPPPPPTSGIAFTAAGTAGDMTIHLAKEDGTAANILRLQVRASMVTDLFGLGFDLVYPQGVLEFNDGSELEGGFLSGDGSTVELLIEEQPAGRLLVGITRLGNVGGVDGSGLILTLEFTGIANGQGSFAFVARDAFDSAGDILGETVWQAGEVNVSL